MKAIQAFAPFWNSCSLLLFCSLAGTLTARAGGIIYNPTQADLEAALAGGGTATFACSGTIVLTNTITISADTILDGNGYAMTISGGNAVRLFQVGPSVNFWIKSLTLSDGRVAGADGADGNPPLPGQDAFAGAILSQGGTLMLTSCVLQNNTVQAGNGGNESTNTPPATGGAAFGGAIYVSGGNLNMTNCSVVGSTLTSGRGTLGGYYTPAGDAGNAAGGAIYLLNATAVLQGITMSDNVVAGGVASVGNRFGTLPMGSRGGAAAGGAVYAKNSSVWLANSFLFGNMAIGGGTINAAAAADGYGAGAGLGAGLFLSPNSSAMIQLCSFTNNSSNGGGGGRWQIGGTGLGGAIFNMGQASVWDSRFSQNQAHGGVSGRSLIQVGRGGALFSSNLLAITAATFDSNTSIGGDGEYYSGPGEGGALWGAGTINITNCTFSTNLALGGIAWGQVGRGGPGRGGAIMTAGGGMLVNLTIAGNRADGQTVPGSVAGPAQGGGLAVTNTPPTIRGTIIANSTNGSNAWGVVTDAGYNICSDGSAGFTALGSLNNTDPLLASLTNNGGPTLTMGLYLGSPALDRIPSGYPPTDQRGVSRPQGPAAEVGAYEGPGLTPPPPPSPYQPELSIYLVRGKFWSVAVGFDARSNVLYRLLSSSNLTAWSSIATNSTPTDGRLTFTQSFSAGPVYYRVATP